MTQPDPRLGFTTRNGSKALSLLAETLKKRAGLVVVTGEAGVGKSTFLRKFVLQQRERGQAVFVPEQPAATVDEFLKRVCAEAGAQPSGDDRISHLYALREHLDARLKSGDTCAVVAENADDASDAMLRDLALLVELERSNMRPIQVVMTGTSRVIERLNTPEFNAARKEVGAVIKLEPFERDETGAYLQHCLTAAGYRGPSLFSFAAVERIHAKTRGVPRAINQIAVAVLSAFKRGGGKLSPEAIEAAVAEALAIKVSDVAETAPVAAPIVAPVAPPPSIAPVDSTIVLPAQGALMGQPQAMTVRMMLDKLETEFNPPETVTATPPAPPPAAASEPVAPKPDAIAPVSTPPVMTVAATPAVKPAPAPVAPKPETIAPAPTLPAVSVAATTLAIPSPAPAVATPAPVVHAPPAPAAIDKDAVIAAAAQTVAPTSPVPAAPAASAPAAPAVSAPSAPAKPAEKPTPTAAELVAMALEEVDAAANEAATPIPAAPMPTAAPPKPEPIAPKAAVPTHSPAPDAKPHNSARQRLLARLTGR